MKTGIIIFPIFFSLLPSICPLWSQKSLFLSHLMKSQVVTFRTYLSHEIFLVTFTWLSVALIIHSFSECLPGALPGPGMPSPMWSGVHPPVLNVGVHAALPLILHVSFLPNVLGLNHLPLHPEFLEFSMNQVFLLFTFVMVALLTQETPESRDCPFSSLHHSHLKQTLHSTLNGFNCWFQWLNFL